MNSSVLLALAGKRSCLCHCSTGDENRSCCEFLLVVNKNKMPPQNTMARRGIFPVHHLFIFYLPIWMDLDSTQPDFYLERWQQTHNKKHRSSDKRRKKTFSTSHTHTKSELVFTLSPRKKEQSASPTRNDSPQAQEWFFVRFRGSKSEKESDGASLLPRSTTFARECEGRILPRCVLCATTVLMLPWCW